MTMPITEVVLDWPSGAIPFSAVSTTNSDVWDQKGFYMFLGGKLDSATHKWTLIKLLYIGQAFSQTIRDRVKQAHDAFKCIEDYLKQNAGHSLLVQPGTIKQTSQQKITQELFSDIENCLVSSNKPLCNTLLKYSYAGRTIQITNTNDYIPLREYSSCSG